MIGRVAGAGPAARPGDGPNWHWYRYQRQFGEALRAELGRRETRRG